MIHLYSEYKDHILHEHSETVRNCLVNIYEICQTNHMAVSLENWFTRRELVNTAISLIKQTSDRAIRKQLDPAYSQCQVL